MVKTINPARICGLLFAKPCNVQLHEENSNGPGLVPGEPPWKRKGNQIRKRRKGKNY